MKFEKSKDSSWNVLVVYVNSQSILTGSKIFFTFCLIDINLNIHLIISFEQLNLWYGSTVNLLKSLIKCIAFEKFYIFK